MRLPLRRAAFANGLDPHTRAATVLREMPRAAIHKAPQWVDVAFPRPTHVISSRDLYRDTDAFCVHQHSGKFAQVAGNLVKASSKKKKATLVRVLGLRGS